MTSLIQQEFDDIVLHPLPGWFVSQAGNVADRCHWIGVIAGAPATPYAGHHYRVDIAFPQTYPADPPDIAFAGDISHPKVNVDGQICLGVWMGPWPPAIPIRALLEGISGLLNDPREFTWPAHDCFPEADVVDSVVEDTDARYWAMGDEI
jgi:ubiquitin-protein ligase